MAETITISIGELRGTARKALEGAGVPDGFDRDGAEAAVWLQSRGFGGVELLARDLGAARRLTSNMPRLDGALLEMRGVSAAHVGGLIVELAQSRAATINDIATLQLDRCRSPMALAGAMAAAGNRGWSATLTIEGESRIVATPGGVSIDPALAIHIEENCELTVAPPMQSLPALLVETMASPSDLDGFYQRSLERGLTVSATAWAELVATAKLVLVPASEHSRSRGAGAEVDDNE